MFHFAAIHWKRLLNDAPAETLTLIITMTLVMWLLTKMESWHYQILNISFILAAG